MNLGMTRRRVRPTLTVLASVAAVTGMLLAPATVSAGKALPTLDAVSSTCSDGMSSASFEMTGGKGRWVRVSTWLIVDGERSSQPTGYSAARIERGSDVEPSASGLSTGQAVEWEVSVVTNKGVPVGEPELTTPVTC